jgi:Ras-related protein Rab-22
MPSREESEGDYDTERSLKLILLGDTSVGKTSLALRFANDEFRPYMEATIGASFSEPTMIMDRQKITFHVWDTAGQEKYHALASMYYRGASAAVVVFDISRPSSFFTLQRWVEELFEKGPAGIALVVCGNKLDLEASGDRQVTREEAEGYANQIGACYMETSARDATNVREMFEMVARKVPDTSNSAPDNGRTIQLGGKSSFLYRVKGCCA